MLTRSFHQVYFGDIGKDSNVIRSYFAKNGAHCPENANPAECAPFLAAQTHFWLTYFPIEDMLEAIGAGSRRMVGKKDWADIWRDSEELVQVKAEIEELKAEGLKIEDSTDPNALKECKSASRNNDEVSADPSSSPDSSSFAHQLAVVSRRTMTAFWRSPDYVRSDASPCTIHPI